MYLSYPLKNRTKIQKSLKLTRAISPLCRKKNDVPYFFLNVKNKKSKKKKKKNTS